MNILLVSGTHPHTPHISGIRAARFAEELARLGHRCVLLCPSLLGESEAPAEGHDWSTPLVIAVREPATRASTGPFAQLTTAMHVVRFGGKRVMLSSAMLERALTLTNIFPIDAVWTTFGSLEAVFAARSIARAVGAPWLLDIKDNVDIYIPTALRGFLARRLRGFGALQTNAKLHAQAAERWLEQPTEVVYSGVDTCFFPDAPRPVDRYVTLVGGLYHAHLVDAFVDGVAAFNRTARAPIGIVHLGVQLAMLEASAARYAGLIATSSPGYASPAQMAVICQSALANCYVFFGRGFHHKLLELLACRRPVIAFGGELPESIALAAQLHAPLYAPESPTELATMLARIDAPGYAIDPALPAQFFTWPQQAAMVDAAMRRLVE
jgi:hypothetical protein